MDCSTMAYHSNKEMAHLIIYSASKQILFDRDAMLELLQYVPVETMRLLNMVAPAFGPAVNISIQRRKLSFCNMGFASFDKAALYTLEKNLTYANLSGLAIPKEQFCLIAKLTQLQQLDLSYNNVDDGSAAHLAKLTNLQYLTLNGTKVGNAGAMHLTALTNLRELHLRCTQIGAAGAAHLTKLTNLIQLNLSAAQVDKKIRTFLHANDTCKNYG